MPSYHMRSIGPRLFGLDFHNGEIGIRVPIKVYNTLKLWYIEAFHRLPDIPNIRDELAPIAVKLLEDVELTLDLDGLLIWFIISIPLLSRLRGRVKMTTRAGVGEPIVAGRLVVRESAEDDD